MTNEHTLPTPIATFTDDHDPGWEVGDVVPDPNGNAKLVTDKRKTLGNLRVTYFGVPADRPAHWPEPTDTTHREYTDLSGRSDRLPWEDAPSAEPESISFDEETDDEHLREHFKKGTTEGRPGTA